MPTRPTIRIRTITHAQAIRLPGHDLNSVQIDALDQDGKAVRIILEPQVLEAMLEPVVRHRDEFGLGNF